MAKVTSKLQVTIPKAIAEQFGLRPGDEIQWVPAGEAVRVVPAKNVRPGLDTQERLKLFDQATVRQRERGTVRPRPLVEERGWTRGELYRRDRVGGH